MSHTVLDKTHKSVTYVRQIGDEVYTIWVESMTGDARGCVILSAYAEGVAEMQIPLQSLPIPDFQRCKDVIEEFCVKRKWEIIFGFTTEKMGNFLIEQDHRVSWREERVQVENNEKRKLVWNLIGGK